MDAEEAGNVDWNAVESWGSNSSAGSAFSEIPAGMLVVVGANCLDVCTSGIGNGGGCQSFQIEAIKMAVHLAIPAD